MWDTDEKENKECGFWWTGEEDLGGEKTIEYFVFKNSISNIKISYIIKKLLHSNQFLNSNIFFSILLLQHSLIIQNYHQYIKLSIIKTMTLEF